MIVRAFRRMLMVRVVGGWLRLVRLATSELIGGMDWVGARSVVVCYVLGSGFAVHDDFADSSEHDTVHIKEDERIRRMDGLILVCRVSG